MAGFRKSYRKYAPKYKKSSRYGKKYGGMSAKGSYKRYGTRYSFKDRFATLSNSVSPSPASLRPGQGSYSRAAFARAAVRTDLEIKNIDVVSATQPWSALGALNGLPAAAADLVAGAYGSIGGTINGIGAGSSSNQREGRKVVVKGIESRFTFQLKTTAVSTATSAVCRLVTVLDRQCNAATFGMTDLFETAAAGQETTAVYNLANAQRFKVLSDETFELNAQAAVGANSVAPTKSKVVKMVLNVPIEFGADSAVINSNIRSNNLIHVLLVQGLGTVNTTAVTRCYYVG